MNEPLDELYITWLYRQVGSTRFKNPARTYWSLVRQLYRKEFVWFIPNDDNRVEDCLELRQEFINTERIEDPDSDWFYLDPSMLELLLVLSRALSFEAEGEARDWFWRLIENVVHKPYSDADPLPQEEFDYIFDLVILRLYNRNGSGGGLFPLRRATKDQRNVELWYQLNAYLLEQ